MKQILAGVLIAGITGFWGCSLDGGSDEFSCEDEPNITLFDNVPEDTVYVKVESPDTDFNRTFSGIRLAESQGFPVDGEYKNLAIYEREPKPDNGKLFGLGTQVTDPMDSAGIVISFNFGTGSQIAEVCRSTKVFQLEHDWSRWEENIIGVEILMTIPRDGEWVTFSSDTDQNDADLLLLNGAEFLDEVGFYARLSGTYSVLLSEVNSSDPEPEQVEVSGSFILDMRVSR